ncbi:hypothetical protein KA531_02715 [Candidatus Saccharibacteria bacterium]|nr:hypothetical protein [Candidatus Saccharibacteria bacterium]
MIKNLNLPKIQIVTQINPQNQENNFLINNLASNIKNAFVRLFVDKVSLSLLISGLIVFALMLILAFLRIRPSAIDIPLGFNSYLKVDNLGAWHQIFYLPAFGLFCIIANVLLVLNSDTSKKLTQYLLLATNLILILTLVVIINLTSLTFIR